MASRFRRFRNSEKIVDFRPKIRHYVAVGKYIEGFAAEAKVNWSKKLFHELRTIKNVSMRLSATNIGDGFNFDFVHVGSKFRKFTLKNDRKTAVHRRKALRFEDLVGKST